MTLEITASEAWEAVERLRMCVDYNPKVREWCAAVYQPTRVGWGVTPVEAVAQLLERIGETATVCAEVANA